MLTFRCKNDGVTKLFPQLVFYVRKVDVGLIFVDGVYRDGSCQDHQKSPSEREKIPLYPFTLSVFSFYQWHTLAIPMI